MKGTVQVRGDYGNPSGTGLGKIVVDNLESATAALGLTDMDTFVDSLVTGNFTECNVGDVSVTTYTTQFTTKPAAGVNIDSQLVVHFRKKTDSTIRKLTISGIAETSTVLEAADAGKRLTEAGKTALEGYLDTLFGWTTEAVVLYGKLLVKP
ncbi:hypothetical protein KAR91_02100 [Candidatus Pacearchaeota archaeon]|nr:hypothetical protein [Candidatus Pacearchaeota archaeon]